MIILRGSRTLQTVVFSLLMLAPFFTQAKFEDQALKTCVDKAVSKQGIASLGQLSKLKCHNKKIQSLKGIQQLSSLTYLSLFGNKLVSADVSGLKELTYLNVAKNDLNSLKIEGLGKLTELFAFKNKLTSLNLIGLTSLEKLRMMDNKLKSLDISGLASLKAAYLWNNQLEDLDIRGLDKLTFLDVKQNPMPDELYDFYDEQTGITISHDGNADDWK